MDILRLMEQVAHAAATSWTATAACKRLRTALPEHWGVIGLEVGHAETASDSLRVVAAHRDTLGLLPEPTTRRPLRSSFGGQLLHITEPFRYLSPVQARVFHEASVPTAGTTPDAVGLGLFGCPLRLPRGQRRSLVLFIAPGAAGPPTDNALWRALARLFEAAIAHVELVERVAALSQRVHHENRQLKGEIEALKKEPSIIAESPQMRDVVAQAQRVAEYDTTVLIQGESGTGKELLARHIHLHSTRASGPFVAVNCGALPAQLVESELFGHEEGAFTGAHRRRLGRFERAHGGTLFLDEVAEMSLSSQVKLLRVLQEGHIEPVGGQRSVTVDVRVIAASHRSLADMVESGRFRPDLFYRLNVFPLVVPPLRERPEDVAAIVHKRLEQLCAQHRRPVPHLSPDTLAKLCRAPWPGNVRELENTLERALILSPGNTLQVAMAATGPAPAAPSRPPLAGPVETFQAATKRCIAAALAATGGRVYGHGGAAQLLGLKPSTLQTKMAKLGVKREHYVRRHKL